jgi:predicted TIM-barrel fold metal-dependent hydrolase
VIDQHAHPFALEGGPLDLSEVSLDVRADDNADPRRRRDGPARTFQELLTVRLAHRLRCDPDDLAPARAEASRDWPSYCAALFAEAGITDLVLDAGFSPEAESHLDDYARLSGCAVHPIFRIEPLVDGLIGEGLGAAAVVAGVQEGMEKAAAGGAVGFKTIAAYRTGLAIDPFVTVADADDALRTERDVPVRRRAKPCRDLVVRRALGMAVDLGLPFQVHTGLGDSDIRLSEADPLLLQEILRTPEGSAVVLVLIHGAYPWHEQLAHLATVTPNVHAELSLHQLFSPLTTADRLLRVLDLAPTTKVLLGTDGHGEPETFWFAATILRQAWAEVAATMRDAGARHTWVDGVERAIFETNARRIYGI